MRERSRGNVCEGTFARERSRGNVREGTFAWATVGKGQSGRCGGGKGKGIERLSCGCRSLLAAVKEGGGRGRAEGTVGGRGKGLRG